MTSLLVLQVRTFVKNLHIYKRELEISMMENLFSFLRLHVHQTNDGVLIRQSRYANDILDKFSMNFVKRPTPMSSSTIIHKDEYNIAFDKRRCRGCQSFMFNCKQTRYYVQCMFLCSIPIYQKEYHLKAVKRISRYLKGTTDLGSWYPRGRI